MVVKRKLEIPVFQEWRMKKLEPFVGIFTMVGILCLIQIMIGNRWTGAHIFFISLSALLIGGGLLKRPLRKCIWRFTETEAERIMFGHCTKISYQEIADALRTKNIKVTMTSFKVPKSRGYIAFHYEVGDAAAQERVLESYRFLCKKMEALGVGEEKSFPELTKRLVGQMDRSWFYKKGRRNSSIWMIISTLLCAGLGGEIEFDLFCIVAVLAAVQYTQIRTLFKSIYFGKTIEEKIQAVFSECLKVDLRKTHITYLQLFGMTIVMVLGNLFWFVVSISA